jgi:predicted Fe-Mo cluster-binding NifX family protein
MKIAIPVIDGTYTSPLEKAKEFAIITVENGIIKGQENTFPNPHEVSSLNAWLQKIGVELVLVGCMEPRKSMNIKNNGIKVIFCSACLSPNKMVKLYLKGII